MRWARLFVVASLLPGLLGSGWAQPIHSNNPLRWPAEARSNYRSGTFFATDLTVHPTQGAALRRSLAPVDMRANVSAAVRAQLNPLSLAGNLILPLTLAMQRQLATEGTLDAKQLMHALDPKVYAGSVAGSIAGGLAGATAATAAQSALCGLGPAGVVAGLVLNPLINFFVTTGGMNVGAHLGEGMSLRDSIAQSLRDIRPARDTGQALGLGIGYIMGQVLIPIPVVGGIVGSMVGGLIGAAVGDKLGKIPALAAVDAALRGALDKVATWISGKKAGPTTVPTRAGVPLSTGAGARPGAAAGGPPLGAVAPRKGTAPPPESPGFPTMEDLPVVAH